MNPSNSIAISHKSAYASALSLAHELGMDTFTANAFARSRARTSGWNETESKDYSEAYARAYVHARVVLEFHDAKADSHAKARARTRELTEPVSVEYANAFICAEESGCDYDAAEEYAVGSVQLLMRKKN